jgi:hypothetical protein
MVMMKTATIATGLLLLFAANLSFSQSSPTTKPHLTAYARLAGVWRGDLENLPGVAIVFTDEGGELSGAALFYLHTRKIINGLSTSTPGPPEPIFNLKFDAKTLPFDASHRRASASDARGFSRALPSDVDCTRQGRTCERK